MISLLRGTTLGRKAIEDDCMADARAGVRDWLSADDGQGAIVDTADITVFSNGEEARNDTADVIVVALDEFSGE